MKWSACIVLAALGLIASARAQPASAAPRAVLVADTVVDPAAWTFPNGNWGTTVNGQTFQQEAVISHRGHQYAAYFADGGVLSIARRQLPAGEWQVIRFDDYKARDHRDAHNVASMGLCAGDGTIHLAFDHHNDTMHYRRSVAQLASEPQSFEWRAEHFGPVTSSLEAGKPISNVTYPQFFSTPRQTLQLVYRTGSSGDGDWHLMEYDPRPGAWTTVGTLLSRRGQYQTSPSRCGYPNPPRYDSKGRLHLTWCWRERPANAPFDLRTNHDLLYAASDDLGRTWRAGDGAPIADLRGGGDVPASIGIDSPGIVAVPTRWLWGQMNTTTQFIDHHDRVHVIHWQHDQDAAQGSKDLNTWRYDHYWRDAEGKWHTNRLPFHGRKPQIVLDPTGRALVVFTRGDNANYHNQEPGGRLTVAVASEASGWTDWQEVFTTDRVSIGEPLLDHPRWASDQTLSIYLQDKPDQPGQPSALRVIDLSISAAAAR